ncbi:MAG: glycosyltransferase family 4 protein [Burkholderiales bacterium]|nr:glycosyltransferase family 4 protein [Burkholderiales bacterium]
MNILYLNHYAGSPALGMEYRPYYLAREWVRQGHAVQVVAASYSHVRARQPKPGDERIDGIAYRWLPTPTYRDNGWNRALNIWRYVWPLWCQANRLAAEFKPEVVIASSTYPMDIWAAHRIARAAGAQLVFEVHDLWPLSPVEVSGASPHHPFILLCGAAERFAYRHADRVVSMLPVVHDYMAARGLDLKRLTIVPNGIVIDEWEGAPPAPLRDDVVAQAIAAQRAAGRTVVGYAGSMGLPNALDVLLDAAALLRDEPIAIVLVGDGLERARLAERIRAEALSNVSLLSPVPKAQIPALLAQFDIAYIGWQKLPIYRFGIAPNKLMDYMMAARPVLHSVQAGNDPVAESGCGLTVAPESPTAVADGLRRLAATPAEARRAMGERGRAFVRAHHSYPVLAERFLQALQR